MTLLQSMHALTAAHRDTLLEASAHGGPPAARTSRPADGAESRAVPLPCPKSNPAHPCPPPSVSNVYWDEYEVHCPNHYDADCVGDPAEYVCISLRGMGRGREAAIADWNEAVTEWRDDHEAT